MKKEFVGYNKLTKKRVGLYTQAEMEEMLLLPAYKMIGFYKLKDNAKNEVQVEKQRQEKVSEAQKQPKNKEKADEVTNVPQ